ncbi:formate dehydrogenase accessory sulfurtransferase FdhD [Dehalococcoidales bacterium]|nr:formate dehydrogenase accessory sulfurtransferase FdhD [Dehalococcoidales bacterium]
MIERFPILRVTEQDRSWNEDIITQEFPLTIMLNNQELVTLLCSPTDLKYLAVGFLSSEGLVKSKDEIKKIIVDEQRGVVRVETDKPLSSELLFKRLITSGCGRGASFYSPADVQSKVESQMVISAHQVFALINEFQHRSLVYKATGGVHGAALCHQEGILLFSEDIGRHNAIDKLFGQCLLSDIPMDERIIITSGRISSEILLKVAKRGIPILISKSAPTSLGVRLAADLGVTLIGFARGKRMNVYTEGWRVVADGK